MTQSYDIVYTYAQAIASLKAASKSPLNVTLLLAALKAVDFPGVSNPIKFTATGDLAQG